MVLSRMKLLLYSDLSICIFSIFILFAFSLTDLPVMSSILIARIRDFQEIFRILLCLPTLSGAANCFAVLGSVIRPRSVAHGAHSALDYSRSYAEDVTSVNVWR